MKLYFALLAAFVCIFVGQEARAVPPPDFVFSAGSAIVQVFSLVFLFLSAAAGSAYQFVKVRLTSRRSKVVFFALSLVVIMVLAGGGAFIYDYYYQRHAYAQWLAQSQAMAEQAKTSSTAGAISSLVISSLPISTEAGGDMPQAVTSTTRTIAVQVSPSSTQTTDQGAFFAAHESLVPTTTEQAFQAVVSSTRQDYMVLDAREDLEYELGRFPGGVHIRAADLRAGRWAELPRNKFVYVFCWSGMRGLEVAEFLRSHQILAISLDGGASGWVAAGGRWDGLIDFKDRYPEERYTKVFTTQELVDRQKVGVFLVDSREPERYRAWHIPGSINIPLLSTPTSQVDDALAQVPAGVKVITICDLFVNCFDAKLTGIELERRGHTFLGRYNEPWDMMTN